LNDWLTKPAIVVLTAVAGICFAGNETPPGPAAQPPCHGALPQPGYAQPGTAPRVLVWSSPKPVVPSSWDECIQWSTPAARTLVAVAGRFASADTANDLLTRFGAVSQLLALRYWSVTDHAWRPLVSSATALTRLTSGAARPDFSAAEMRSGDDLYLAQRDGRSASEAIYRIRVREFSAAHFIVETENLTPIRWWGIVLFKSGDIQSRYFLEQRAAGVWSYYSLTKIAGSSWIAAGHDSSYVNRVIALYRSLARIPSDREPPAAP
jgi:hypothetical protein